MKRTISLIISILLINIYACEDKTKGNTKTETLNVDSLILRLEKEKEIKESADEITDSITLIEQNKVIGDVVFGMTEKEGKKKIKEFIKKSMKTKYTDSDLTYPFIGNYEFSEFGTRSYYHNNKLYYLKIKGGYIQWDEYKSEVPREVRYITDVIKLKYGEPSYNRPIPERHKTEKGNSYLINTWLIGTKKIDIKINDEGTYYSVDVNIYQPAVVRTVNEEIKNEKDEITESDKNVF